MKIFTVVAYDITDDRRRSKVASILEKVGIRCNESVFECLLTESQLVKLKLHIAERCDVKKDSILFYTLCRDCVAKRSTLGLAPERDSEVVIV
jgi:CRISPR-associated protein Cas2